MGNAEAVLRARRRTLRFFMENTFRTELPIFFPTRLTELRIFFPTRRAAFVTLLKGVFALDALRRVFLATIL
jgi:hypothetical protein